MRAMAVAVHAISRVGDCVPPQSKRRVRVHIRRNVRVVVIDTWKKKKRIIINVGLES